MSSTYTLQDQQLMALAKNYFAWQCRLVVPKLGRRVVEIGCGIGNFTGMLLDRDAVMAVDIEAECVSELQARYAGRNHVYALQCDWNAPDWTRRMQPVLQDFRPDSCVCLNVLEHIEDDREALCRMRAILPPGGVVVLLVPAFPSLYGPIDRLLGHYRRYNRKSLRHLAREAGLEIEELRYMNAIGFFGWWANARLFRREVQSAAQIQFFDRYIVPVASRSESLIPPPFGQSLLAVLTRP